MGERWKIDGRRWEGCGPGMPGPYGGWKGERVPAGNGQTEGSRPLPTVWGETGWQSSNGWLWKACGPGMPGPYGVEGGVAAGHYCVYCRIRSKISLRILCKSRILLL